MRNSSSNGSKVVSLPHSSASTSVAVFLLVLSLPFTGSIGYARYPASARPPIRGHTQLYGVTFLRTSKQIYLIMSSHNRFRNVMVNPENFVNDLP